MAFRAPHSKETPPKCCECGAGSPRVVSYNEHGEHWHEWLCAACEYRRAFPDAPTVPLPPRDRRPAKLQSVTLL